MNNFCSSKYFWTARKIGPNLTKFAVLCRLPLIPHVGVCSLHSLVWGAAAFLQYVGRGEAAKWAQKAQTRMHALATGSTCEAWHTLSCSPTTVLYLCTPGKSLKSDMIFAILRKFWVGMSTRGASVSSLPRFSGLLFGQQNSLLFGPFYYYMRTPNLEREPVKLFKFITFFVNFREIFEQ